ncbi:hypothetical protein Pden_4627 (plasmid) [Paracoccus denitrificans PD1222]|uniref:Uncharacterized protein n=1 Tax=Paracoccus denitrificans (strain Pd 1222) TaxID=318586 RepID=A1BAZ6_PARDP|nr:hypothetical protein Pden_4627 [Paracoccus denitrificans PD1222]
MRREAARRCKAEGWPFTSEGSAISRTGRLAWRYCPMLARTWHIRNPACPFRPPPHADDRPGTFRPLDAQARLREHLGKIQADMERGRVTRSSSAVSASGNSSSFRQVRPDDPKATRLRCWSL